MHGDTPRNLRYATLQVVIRLLEQIPNKAHGKARLPAPVTAAATAADSSYKAVFASMLLLQEMSMASRRGNAVRASNLT